MKYATVSSATPNAMQLQSIGWVLGQPVKNIKLNDVLMWNFGETERVVEVIKETPKMIVIKVESKSGNYWERKMNKERLVCILEN